MPKETLSPGLTDKRVVERNIKKGLLSRDQYDKHLSALPDVTAQAEVIKAKLGEEEPEEAAADDLPEEEETESEG